MARGAADQIPLSQQEFCCPVRHHLLRSKSDCWDDLEQDEEKKKKRQQTLQQLSLRPYYYQTTLETPLEQFPRSLCC